MCVCLCAYLARFSDESQTCMFWWWWKKSVSSGDDLVNNSMALDDHNDAVCDVFRRQDIRGCTSPCGAWPDLIK